MKNKKLTLNALKVNSFVTSFDKEGVQTVKGGGTIQIASWQDDCTNPQPVQTNDGCLTNELNCPTRVGIGCVNLSGYFLSDCC